MQVAGQQSKATPGEALQQYYSALLGRFGPQRWWPARTRLEVILGAILTQNTSWRNATLALRKLRKAGRLSWVGLRQASQAELEWCILPAGFYHQKAAAIRHFVDWAERAHRGSLAALFSLPTPEFRRQLVQLKGFGPETADAIILYAARKPSFVADMYSRRVLSRHALLPPIVSYAAAQQFLHHHLPPDQALFNEFHALLVRVGKEYCRRQASRCEGCPLEGFLLAKRTAPNPQAPLILGHGPAGLQLPTTQA